MSVVVRLASRQVIEIHLREAPGGVSVETAATLTGPEKEEVAQTMAWMLGLDQDFSEFYSLASREPRLTRAAERAQGRILRCQTLFEDVVKTILTTNTLWAATKRMNANLVAQFGDPLISNPEAKAFPTPASLAATDETTLRTQTRLGYRAPSVLALAQRVAAGEFDLESLKNSDMPAAELRKKLQTIRGIGPYASANLLMLLGRYNFLTVDSLGDEDGLARVVRRGAGHTCSGRKRLRAMGRVERPGLLAVGFWPALTAALDFKVSLKSSASGGSWPSKSPVIWRRSPPEPTWQSETSGKSSSPGVTATALLLTQNKSPKTAPATL